MKHDVLKVPSTQNVLKMLFECKTFDEQSEEIERRNLEAFIKVDNKKIDFLAYSGNEVRPIPI
jgi:hypothetical protein